MDVFKPARLLVLQHFHAEHLGRFRPLIETDGAEICTVALDQGEQIPDLDGFDAVWALGGPMQVWEEDRYPWLIKEKAAIREAVVDRNLPFFGLCLGHQLLADSLGGEVGQAAVPEVGILPIHLTDAGRASPLFRNFEANVNCIQGHGAEVSKPPPGSVILAQSPDCQVQALSYGSHAFSIQFHSELTLDMVDACLELPEYKSDFEALLGKEGIAEFRNNLQQRTAMFEANASLLYENWKACQRRTCQPSGEHYGQ